MKRIIATILALTMLLLSLTACNGTVETTVGDTTTADTTIDTTTADTTTETEDITSTTVDTTESETTTKKETTAKQTTDPNDNTWKEKLPYKNGILESYIGSFKTTTIDSDASKIEEIDANIMLEYDATIVILFTYTCGYCKNMMTELLQPLYEEYEGRVLVLGVLYEANKESSTVSSVNNWKKQNGITFPIITLDGTGFKLATDGKGIGSLGTGVPQTYILDRGGQYYSGIYGYPKSTAKTKITTDILFMTYDY